LPVDPAGEAPCPGHSTAALKPQLGHKRLPGARALFTGVACDDRRYGVISIQVRIVSGVAMSSSSG
jgi:hypothetical protein